MMRILIFLIITIGYCFPLRAQYPFRVMTYNVENLFDVRHDSLKDDHEFLPEGDKRWNRYKYWKKLNGLSKVLVAPAESRLPDVVILCEVENDTVLYDLTRRSVLRTMGYRYVKTESPDARGVDVALLYQPGSFRLLSSRSVRIPSQREGFAPTRDLLYVTGKIRNGDTLHIIGCHLPSKYSGTRKADRHRMLAAKTLRNLCDSIMKVQPKAALIVTGDFNATHSESVFRKELLLSPYIRPLEVRPLFHPRLVKGSYKYQGYWSQIDHILVSSALYEKQAGVELERDTAMLADYPFLLERDETHGGVKPFRTFLGPRYLGGYSDHLPLLLDLLIRDDKARCSESSLPDKPVR